MSIESESGSSLALMINTNGMSPAEPGLSHKLIQSYLGLLDLDDRLPRCICFYGEGVKLLVEGSHVLEELTELEGRGVELIVCGTCLNHFDLAAKLRIGRQGTMKDIIAAQWECEKVITL